ncbi:glycosyltransferase family 4 protein [Carboxylicivirga sp. M1479]|uniref:glycosyltransferase family 4 protein n=1 Tax=Carboxylicivirga sp. M1479 TaxID=2594476 RepID=UPI00163DBCCF|nr:glycosyltransferase family 4 protein [Carboxylicivirga sp. M1479]
MKKPKVIIFGVKYFPSKGGTSRVVENIIHQLKDKYDITLLCYKNKAAQNHMDGIKVVEFTSWFQGSLGALFYFLRSALYALTQTFDIIHIHKIDAAFFIPWFYKKGVVIATSHESAYLRDKWGKLEKKYLMQAEKTFLNSKAVLTCISNPLTQNYNQDASNKVKYIPNGITINDQYKEKEATDFLTQHQLDEGNYYFFAARRIMKTKGAHTLLAALDKINYEGKIVIAGDLSHNKEYRHQLQENYKHLNIIFPGYISDLPLLLTLIKKAKLFVFPSETEGMSIMLLEAVSTLTPIIASDIKENKEVFDDQHLTFFKSEDSNDLASKISWFESNKEIAKRQALEAVTHVKNNYSWSEIAKQYDGLYTKSLN